MQVNLNDEREAIELAYGLLWHMRTDTRDPNLELASAARKALLAVMSKENQAHGISLARNAIRTKEPSRG